MYNTYTHPSNLGANICNTSTLPAPTVHLHDHTCRNQKRVANNRPIQGVLIVCYTPTRCNCAACMVPDMYACLVRTHSTCMHTPMHGLAVCTHTKTYHVHAHPHVQKHDARLLSDSRGRRRQGGGEAPALRPGCCS